MTSRFCWRLKDRFARQVFARNSINQALAAFRRECVMAQGQCLGGADCLHKPPHPPKPMIRAGLPNEATPHSGDWAFVDPGFASRSRSCGLLLSTGTPVNLTFGELRDRLQAIVCKDGEPLNLVLEAPLSVAFAQSGNPTGRAIERRDGKSRYWYVGLGCSVLVSVTYLMRAISDAGPRREVRLFEGFVSFKPKGRPSNHGDDVMNLRRVIHGEQAVGRVVPPEALASSPEHTVLSAFAVSGMDFGVPPVVAVGG
jgi:hypothetical protein